MSYKIDGIGLMKDTLCKFIAQHNFKKKSIKCIRQIDQAV